MEIARAAAVFPVPPEEAWDFIFADGGRRALAASKLITAIDDYQMRSDGTPRYSMTMTIGQISIRGTSDYSVFDRPHKTVNRIYDNPVGGIFVVELMPVPQGTRVSERWEVHTNSVMRGAFRVLRPLVSGLLQRDLERWAAASGPPTR
jgi:hypothetical protein